MNIRRTTVHRTLAMAGALVVLAGTTAVVQAAAQAGPADRDHGRRYEIGLFGDMPYGDAGRAQYPAVIAAMNRADLAFSVFDGDIKNGSEPCYADGAAQAPADPGHPDVYKYALNLFDQFRAPVVYVPGDNEWTDCDRPSTQGPTADAVQRLDYVRQVFAGTDRSLGRRTIPLTRQAAPYRENVTWAAGPVTYLGLNVPGSDNDHIPDGDTKDGPQAEANAEYAARNAANLAWIHAGFAAAERRGSRAVMIVLQADMFGDSPDHPEGTTADPTDHFADTKAAIARESAAFGKPVVVVNGDSHYLTIDKPFTDDAGNTIMNVTRVMTFGSKLNHWVSATVDPDDPQVFTFHQHVIGANVPTYTFH